MNAIIIAVQMRLRVLNVASTNQYYTLRIWLSWSSGKLKTEGSSSCLWHFHILMGAWAKHHNVVDGLNSRFIFLASQ